MSARKIVKTLEFKIILTVILIVMIGIVALVSATSGLDETFSDVKKQCISFGVGLVLMALVSLIDYELYGRYWYIPYVICIALLIGVLYTEPINNATSWFKLGGFSFQPSEFAKLVMIIVTARFLSNLKERNISYKELFLQMLYLGALLAVPIFLILIQPDFGTAMVFCVSIFAMFFIWGLDYRIIKYGAVALAAMAPIVYMFFLKPGQKERIRVFFNPSIDPTGSGYNVLQARLAVGSGQFWGMGLFEGTQTQMGFLPAKTTDFIFSVIAEEMGFVVAAILIILLIVLVLQCFVVARNADTFTGTLIATGIGVMFLFHILVNIGMNMGIVPVTGIPLPFVSYGGSSLLTNLIAIGIVLSISFRKKRLNF